jgi:hypothetical protein
VHPVILTDLLQETLVDGVHVDDGKVVHWVHQGSSPQAHHLAVTGSRRSWQRVHDPRHLAREAKGPCTPSSR